jgi:hypothetical protein
MSIAEVGVDYRRFRDASAANSTSVPAAVSVSAG